MNGQARPNPAQRYLTGNATAGGGYEQYAAGLKRYGASGRTAPNIGAVRDKMGYAQRDRMVQVRKQNALGSMQQGFQRNFPQM